MREAAAARSDAREAKDVASSEALRPTLAPLALVAAAAAAASAEATAAVVAAESCDPRRRAAAGAAGAASGRKATHKPTARHISPRSAGQPSRRTQRGLIAFICWWARKYLWNSSCIFSLGVLCHLVRGSFPTSPDASRAPLPAGARAGGARVGAAAVAGVGDPPASPHSHPRQPAPPLHPPPPAAAAAPMRRRRRRAGGRRAARLTHGRELRRGADHGARRPRASAQTPGHVHRVHWYARPPPSRLRSRRQLCR